MKQIILTLTLITMAFTLSGCGGTSIKDPIKVPEKTYVEVPVECPALQKLEVDTLPIDDIDHQTPPSDVAKSYTMSITILEKKLKDYEDIVETCKENEQENDNGE